MSGMTWVSQRSCATFDYMLDEVVITPRGIQQGYRTRLRATVPLVRLWVERDLRARYRHSGLRSAWTIVQPVALLLTYGWVFTAVLDVPQEDVPYLSFAWAGLVGYNFVAQALGIGVGSILDAGGIVQKAYFPREVLPFAVVGVAAFDLLITFAILLVLAWLQIGPPSIHVLGAILGLGVLVLWVAATTVFVATLAVRFRDLRHAMPLVLRVIFILTPVMYSAELLGDTGSLLLTANPLAVSIDAIRQGVLNHVWPPLWPLLIQVAAGCALLVASVPTVKTAERLISDRL